MSDGSVTRRAKQTAGSVVHQAYHDPNGEMTLSASILMALDEVPRFDVENSDTVVFDHIDLDALDDLFTPVDDTNRSGSVTFTIESYEVTATAEGQITIRERGPSIT